jgi:hypothetical protein
MDNRSLGKKMFNLTQHQLNAKQNHSEISLYPSRMDITKRQMSFGAGENVEKWNPCNYWWECKLV